MRGILTYDGLKRNAIKTRAELFEQGDFLRVGRRVRKKPRSREDMNILYERAIERASRYKPYYDKDGNLVLPYFL